MDKNSSAVYNPRRDGDVEDYIDGFEHGSYPWFLGSEQYKLLLGRGIIEPNISSIRVMNGQSMDEHYGVIDAETLQGVHHPVHSGRPGLHKIVDILDRGIPFEAIMMVPRSMRKRKIN